MSAVAPRAPRRASPDDAPRILALVREAYAKWVPLIGREPLPMQADYARAIREHEIDLVEEDGALIGLIECIRAQDHLFLENVAVAVAHQGRGLGRAMLAHAEMKAAQSGLGEIRLLTNAAFEANVRLYLSQGYRIFKREPFRGGEAVHMSKTLVRPNNTADTIPRTP